MSEVEGVGVKISQHYVRRLEQRCRVGGGIVPFMPSSHSTVPPPRGGMSVKQHMIVNALPEESRKKRYLFSIFQLEGDLD